MNETQVIQRLHKAVQAAGSQRQFARDHGMSAPYINDVLHGKRAPGPKILAALNLKAVVNYSVEYREK